MDLAGIHPCSFGSPQGDNVNLIDKLVDAFMKQPTGVLGTNIPQGEQARRDQNLMENVTEVGKVSQPLWHIPSLVHPSSLLDDLDLPLEPLSSFIP